MISGSGLNKIAMRLKGQAELADVGMVQDEIQHDLDNLKNQAIEILSMYGDYLDDNTWAALNNFSASLDKGIGMQDPSKVASEESEEDMEEEAEEDEE